MTFGFGTASGKIILMGEHSVVFGKPAIALPFSEAGIRCYVDFHNQETTIDCVYYTGKLFDAPAELDGIRELIGVTLDYMQKGNFGLHISIESSLPPQRGLGSSAAVSVAVVRSLFDAFKIPLSEEELNALVNVAESIHHSNPSGLDASTIASGKAVYFERGKEKKFINMSMDGVLVVADTGQYGQTKQAVSEVRELWLNNPEDINPIMDRLGELTLSASDFLASNNVEALGQCMTEAHQLLRKINVSNDDLEHLVSVALNAGSLGAKLTGSGKGGCMIALCASFDDAARIAAELKTAGASNTWFYDLKEIISHE